MHVQPSNSIMDLFHPSSSSRGSSGRIHSRPVGEGPGKQQNLGFVLAATIRGPLGPVPDLFRAKNVLQYRDGDRAPWVAASISSFLVAGTAMGTCSTSRCREGNGTQ